MSIIDLALDRSRTAILMLFFLIGAGTVSYLTIPKESNPDINIPVIYVSAGFSGVSASDSERLIVRPLESELKNVDGVKEIRSSGYEGGANITLEFIAGFDAEDAKTEVQEAVDRARGQLPSEMDDPSVHEVNLSEFPIIVLSMSGDIAERELVRYARLIRDEIKALPSVLDVELNGDRNEILEIEIDPTTLESYRLSLGPVISMVRNSNVLVTAGSLGTNDGLFPVKVPGTYETIEDILNQPLRGDGDTVVKLRDVATVKRTFDDPRSFARLTGQPAITLEVSKRSGENVIETAAAVRTIAEEAKKRLPKEVTIQVVSDESKDIKMMLNDLVNNVFAAIALVMILVVALLGLRGGILVGIAIPSSFLAGVLFLQSFGYTVNVVVLFALILSIGLLVDGAVVVSEFADRKLAEGQTAKTAYGTAAKRMAWPVIASTGTTVAAFLPLLFWPGIAGEFMKFMPITLIMVLSAALVVALVLLPVLGTNLESVMRVISFVGFGAAGFFLLRGLTQSLLPQLTALEEVGEAGSEALTLGLPIFAGVIGLVFFCWLSKKATPFIERWIQPEATKESQGHAKLVAASGDLPIDQVRGLSGAYGRLLNRLLNHPIKVLMLCGVTLVAGWSTFATVGKGVVFFPNTQPESFDIRVESVGNLSIFEKDNLVKEVEKTVLDYQAAEGDLNTVYARSFHSRDSNRIGNISISFLDWDQRHAGTAIIESIRKKLPILGGVKSNIAERRGGPGGGGDPVALQITGNNLEELYRAARIARAKFEETDGLTDIKDELPSTDSFEWRIDVDRAQASKFGADVSLVGSLVKLITTGVKVSQYRPDDADDVVDIFIRFPKEWRSLDVLDQVRIPTPQGNIPVSNFVKRTPQVQQNIIRRIDSSRAIKVSAKVRDGVLPNDKVKELETWLATGNPLPPSVKASFRGENVDQQEAQDFLSKAFVVALFLIALILVTQFNSFFSCLVILSAVVMSTVGVMLGHVFMGLPFSIVLSGVGVIALAGIVVNNNIVLIDTYDYLRTTEKTERNAILKTGLQRLRPVLLTTITTTIGLVPMATQTGINFFEHTVSFNAPSAEFWVQLSVSIIFGLILATPMTLLATPCLLQLRINSEAKKAAKAARGSSDAPSMPSDFVPAK